MTSFNPMVLNIKLYWWLQNSYLLPNWHFWSVSQLTSPLHSEPSCDFLSLSGKAKALARAYEALCLCPTFVICLLSLFTVCLFSSNNVTCASWTFPDTLAPLHVYSSPCKCYRPSLASGPCSNTILERRISLSISSYPALFFTGYLSPLCLFIFLWSVFPSSVWAPLK